MAGHTPCGNLSLPVILKTEKYYLDNFRLHWNNRYVAMLSLKIIIKIEIKVFLNFLDSKGKK